MILVDSSVWIDYFRGTIAPETEILDSLLGRDLLLTGDLILTEVLQGFESEREFVTARSILTSFEVLTLGGKAIGIQAAKNFRQLRKKGITIRKTIDTIIATSCIERDLQLLYTDRDFDPFVEHFGLRSVDAI